MDQAALSRSTLQPSDRRRYPRQKVASIIYVQLDSENGGIIRDLGVGGLALQAADKLPGKEDVTLKFRMPETGHSVEVVGGIAWLAQTEKEAGIYFKGLSRATQEEIQRWVGKKQQTDQVSVLGVTRTSAALPQVDSLTGAPHATRAIFSLGKQAAAKPAAKPETYTPKPAPATKSDAEVQHSAYVEAVPKRQWVMPTSLFPSRKGSKADPLSPARVAAQMKELRHLGKILLITAGGLLGLLILILLTAYFPGPVNGSASQQTAAISAESGSVQSSSQSATQSTNAASYVTPPPMHAPVQRTRRSAWTVLVNVLFPSEDDGSKKLLSQDQANVGVWVSQHSGYYYCGGSPEYGTTEPGEMMMQGDALQSGYQPKLGVFCY